MQQADNTTAAGAAAVAPAARAVSHFASIHVCLPARVHDQQGQKQLLWLHLLKFALLWA